MVSASYKGIGASGSGKDVIMILAVVVGLIVVFYVLAKREIGNLGSGLGTALSGAGAALKTSIASISPLKYVDQRTGYMRDYLTGEYTVAVSPEEEIQAAGDIAWAKSLPPSLCPSNPLILFGDIRCIDKESSPIYKEIDYPTSPEELAANPAYEYYFDVATGTFQTRLQDPLTSWWS